MKIYLSQLCSLSQPPENQSIFYVCRYLNSQFIRKQQHSEADINYGGFGVELQEQLLEIGAVSRSIIGVTMATYIN